MDNELKEQIIETLKSYLEYSETMFESVKKDIENGEEISSERANNINDCVRTIHHIVSIVEKVKETAPEVPVQEQLSKYNEIHVNSNEFIKLITMLQVILKPINFDKDTDIIINYKLKSQTIVFEYFKSE